MRLSLGAQAGEDLAFQVVGWIDGWGRRLQGAVHLLEILKVFSTSGASGQVTPGLFRNLGIQISKDEGRQVGVTFRTIHRVATRQASASVSSLRRLLKALAVLVFTVPRGMPVRREISRWEYPPK